MKASSLFLRTAVLCAVAGMGLGIAMGITHDHTLTSVHVHINLVGWASMFLFGLYYRLVPAADGRLARIHYFVAAPAFVVFMVGLTGIFLGRPETFGPLAVVGALVTFASMLLFVWNVFATTGASSAQRVRFEGLPRPAR